MAEKISLSVIVPVYNEEKTVKELLTRLVKIPQVSQVVVVDDFSSDGSVQEIAKVKNSKILLVQHSKNQGKGKAIQTALEKVKGEYVLIQDADMEYDPQDIPLLVEPIKQGKTKVVYGSRFLGSRSNMFFWHFVGNKFLNLVVNILYDSILTDLETCYKVIPAKLMREMELRENDFRIEMEITCKLLKRREHILEVPITYIARGYEEGKKITWVDGFYALWTMTKVKLGVL
jgi:dolichol-phosphate hexosyltransferase